MLQLNICDPAMGSGHFLVEAVTVLAEAIAAHPSTAPRPELTADGRPRPKTDGSGEPLCTQEAKLGHWRRRVVEACIYGVDVNPLAVELAKLSLWLKTVDRRPLNFLDHHLRCGDSLVGTRVDLLGAPRSPKKRHADGPDGPGPAVQLPLGLNADLAGALGDAIAEILDIEGQATDTIDAAPRASDRKRLIAALPQTDPALWTEYQAARARTDQILAFVQRAGLYPLMGRGDTNLYAVFAEKALDLVHPRGRVGLLVPSGIATDHTTQHFFKKLIDERRLAELLDFENREAIFQDIHRSFKFSIILMAGGDPPQDTVRTGFFLHRMADLEDPERTFTLEPADFALFNPNTLTCPIFRRRRDYELTRQIYERVPVLIDKAKGAAGNPWGVSFLRMFDMTNDSHLFRTAKELEDAGFWLGVGNVYTRGAERCLPLYEAKMIHHFDHRYASAITSDERLISTQASEVTTAEQKSDPAFSPVPRYWVPAETVPRDRGFFLGFRDIARATDVRTCIATFIPTGGVSNKLPLIFADFGADLQCCLLANLNALVMDYAARNKVSSTSLNFFIVEQFPILPPTRYAEPFHGRPLVDFIAPRVLELCYTARDLAGFAADMGYAGAPFGWDEERRGHLRCQLDALYFLLYGLSRTEAAEILGTFPIVRRQDEARWGRFRTQELVLAYSNALAAGNLDAWVKG